MSGHRRGRSTGPADDNFGTLPDTPYKLQKQQARSESEKHPETPTPETSTPSSSRARYMMSNPEAYYDPEATPQGTRASIHQRPAPLEDEPS